MRIATWASRLTATLGSAMDPAATMFLEQTVHAAAQIAASARNPKLEYAISQVLRSKPVSSLVAGYVTPFLCSPTINIPPFPAPIHIAPPRFHGRLIPFIDFDGRKRPPHSTSPTNTARTNNDVRRSDYIRIPPNAFDLLGCVGGLQKSWRGGKKSWHLTTGEEDDEDYKMERDRMDGKMEDEEYKLKNDQRTVGTKKEKMERDRMDEKMKDQDPKSEEDEESSPDVKDGFQDGKGMFGVASDLWREGKKSLQLDSTDINPTDSGILLSTRATLSNNCGSSETSTHPTSPTAAATAAASAAPTDFSVMIVTLATLTSPPKEGKERFHELPSAEGNSHIAASYSTVRPHTPPTEIGIPRIDLDGPFTTALCHYHHLASCVLGEKEEGVTGPKPMKTTLRCPTAKGPIRPLTTCLTAPPAFPAPAGMDITSEERKKSRLLNATAIHPLPTMTRVPVSPPVVDLKEELEDGLEADERREREEGGMVGKEDLRCSEKRISLEDVVDWIIGRWTARRKERRSWRHAVSRLPELAPSKFTMDFVGPVICLPPGRPPRFIMTAGLKDGGKVSNSFTDFVGPLAPVFIAPLAREFRLTFEFIAPASVCKSSVDSGPAIASLSMTGRWKDGGKELNLFADFVGPLSNASIPAPLARVPRSRSHRPCNASRLSTWRRSRISRRPCHEVSSSRPGNETEWLPPHLHRLQNPHGSRKALKTLGMTIWNQKLDWIGHVKFSHACIPHPPKSCTSRHGNRCLDLELDWIGHVKSPTPVYNNSEISYE
jgi:hypothetical protein